MANKSKTDILRENIFKKIISYNLLDEELKSFTIKGKKYNDESIILFNEELVQDVNCKGKYVISELGYNMETHQYFILFGPNKIDLYYANYQILKSGYDKLFSKERFNDEIDYLKSVNDLNDKIRNKYFFGTCLSNLIFRNQSSMYGSFVYSFSNDIYSTRGLIKLKNFKIENGLIMCEGLYYTNNVYKADLNTYIPWYMFNRKFKFKYKFKHFKDVMCEINHTLNRNSFIDEKALRLLNKKEYYEFITKMRDIYTNDMRKINVLTGSANIEIVDLSDENIN